MCLIQTVICMSDIWKVYWKVNTQQIWIQSQSQSSVKTWLKSYLKPKTNWRTSEQPNHYSDIQSCHTLKTLHIHSKVFSSTDSFPSGIIVKYICILQTYIFIGKIFAEMLEKFLLSSQVSNILNMHEGRILIKVFMTKIVFLCPVLILLHCMPFQCYSCWKKTL